MTATNTIQSSDPFQRAQSDAIWGIRSCTSESKKQPDSIFRIKNTCEKIFHFKVQIGKGGHGEVLLYCSEPNKTKFIAVKIDHSSFGFLEQEHSIFLKLHAHVIPTGIILPYKAFIPRSESFPSILIMSRYECTLSNWVGRSSVVPHDLVTAVKQIMEGYLFLKENHIYHGDVKLRNSLYGNFKSQKRFDICDFGASFSYENKPTQELFDFISKGFEFSRDTKETIKLYEEIYPEDILRSSLIQILNKKDSDGLSAYISELIDLYLEYHDTLKDEQILLLNALEGIGKSIEETGDLKAALESMNALL